GGERGGGRPVQVAHQAAIVEVAFDDHQPGVGEPGRQLGRQVVEGQRGGPEPVRRQLQPSTGERRPEPPAHRGGFPTGGGQPVQAGQQVGGGGVGDVVRVRLEVQLHLLRPPGAQQVVDEYEVGQQFVPGVVGDQVDGAGRTGRQVLPQRGDVVDDQVGCFSVRGRRVGQP